MGKKQYSLGRGQIHGVVKIVRVFERDRCRYIKRSGLTPKLNLRALYHACIKQALFSQEKS